MWAWLWYSQSKQQPRAIDVVNGIFSTRVSVAACNQRQSLNYRKIETDIFIMSDTFSSQETSSSSFDNGEIVNLYQNIKKTLEEVQMIASQVNSNYNALEVKMKFTAQLITAIQISNRFIKEK
ncbi:uncharacterized protein LOC125500548 isoform X1 [Athalia rosae]|uniref:uncharacterized protein LOC125500548 isoform X1 n=1 Tax=Athalia rosae TaxID=37344 RepID=UPI002033D7C8|nr:uncharacterized protein LOC125500548 isoform X1 [Athalia rosae]